MENPSRCGRTTNWELNCQWLSDSVEAEMGDRGWTKIYEVVPEAELTPEYQAEVGGCLAELIICLHPIYVQLRNDVARVHR